MPASSVKLPAWYRVVTFVVGLVTVALAFVVLADPGLALLTLVFILGFALLVIGFDRIIAGITGHPFGWIPSVVGEISGGTGSGSSLPAPGGPLPPK
jgi:uncharacterized membrane protein HdeD (DUF308 family)